LSDKLLVWDNPYEVAGNWYRGNLHTHTTNSDGKNSTEEMAGWYRQNGYDFLSITDHHKITPCAHLSDDRFLLLEGAEIGRHDVVAVGLQGPLPETRQMPLDQAARCAQELGGVAIVAHPYWAGLGAEEVSRANPCLGLEVYNNVCQYLNGKGNSAVIWDELLARGRRLWAIASDDAHALGTVRFDRPHVGQAWIWLKAPRLSREAVLTALRAGAFYSTQGPEILEVFAKDDSLRVRCSPCLEVRFLASGWRGSTVYAGEGKVIEAAEYRASGEEGYIRIECVDARGRIAWSNPLFVAAVAGDD